MSIPGEPVSAFDELAGVDVADDDVYPIIDVSDTVGIPSGPGGANKGIAHAQLKIALREFVQDEIAALLGTGGGIQVTYDDPGNTLTASITGSSGSHFEAGDYTFVASDVGGTVFADGAGAQFFSIPTDADAPLLALKTTRIDVVVTGTGPLTIAAEDDGTTNVFSRGAIPTAPVLLNPGDSAVLRWADTNSWVVTGDVVLAPSAPSFRDTWLASKSKAGDVQTSYRRLGSTIDVTAVAAAGHKLVIIDQDRQQEHSDLKAASPATAILQYRCMSSTRDLFPSPGGVPFLEADPSWFLQADDGVGGVGPFYWTAFSGGGNHHWQMDVSNPDYQAAWLANVLADLTANGWDGVWIDNVMIYESYTITAPGVKGDDGIAGHDITRLPHGATHTSTAGQNPKWPSDWQTAADVTARSIEFLSAVVPAIQAAGFIVYINSGGDRLFMDNSPDIDVWRDTFAAYTDGFEEEFFVRVTTTNPATGGRNYNLPNYTGGAGEPRGTNAQRLAIQHAEGLATPHPVDCVIESTVTTPTDGSKYALAQFLLATDGYSTIRQRDDDSVVPVIPGFGIPVRFGDALGAATNPVGNVRLRLFETGAVIVNEHTSNISNPDTVGGTDQTAVSLGGLHYLHPTLGDVTAVDVAKGEAWLLPLNG